MILNPVNVSKTHLSIIHDFLTELNRKSPDYILKGGTALLYYGLDRFSEDIDLDGRSKTFIKKFIPLYCKQKGYHYSTKKDTPSVYRVMLDYGPSKLKVEVSLRSSKDFVKVTSANIRGIRLYSLQYLLDLKINTLNARYKIRDLYDVAWLLTSFSLETFTQDQFTRLRVVIRDRFSFNDFELLLRTQHDAILPQDRIELLYERVLKLYELLGLL